MGKKEDSKIDKFEVSRAGLCSFFGNPEKFEITPYGILMAFIHIPLVILAVGSICMLGAYQIQHSELQLAGLIVGAGLNG